MGYCVCCGELVTNECIYNDLSFCSTKCMDKYLLHMCEAGRISFLDLPKETRDRERDRHALQCESKTCPTCGVVFYTSSYLNEHTKKYCSRLCMRIGENRRRKEKWWANVGWMSTNWKGGITNGICCHKFNENLKKRVRAFFGNKCFLCGKQQEKNSRRLSVHHVNYNKNACCDSSRVMLVPLCEVCHGKTNNNREYWEPYFEKILKEEYNYKCYFTKEEYDDFKRKKRETANETKKIPQFMKRYEMKDKVEQCSIKLASREWWK